jgi:hypothetical protein
MLPGWEEGNTLRGGVGFVVVRIAIVESDVVGVRGRELKADLILRGPIAGGTVAGAQKRVRRTPGPETVRRRFRNGGRGIATHGPHGRRTSGRRQGGFLRDVSGLGSGRRVPQKLGELDDRGEVARVEVFDPI